MKNSCYLCKHFKETNQWTVGYCELFKRNLETIDIYHPCVEYEKILSWGDENED